MIFSGLARRLAAAEEKLAALEARLDAGLPGGAETEEQGEAPVFPLDDARMQEGIASLMGYDPFGRKRRDD